MPEYFISCFYCNQNSRKLHCRCSIGDLSENERDLFKEKSDFDKKSNRDFHNPHDIFLHYVCELHSIDKIPLDSMEERFVHEQAIETFEKERQLEVMETPLPPGSHHKLAPAHTESMLKFINIAEIIRRATGAGKRKSTVIKRNVKDKRRDQSRKNRDERLDAEKAAAKEYFTSLLKNEKVFKKIVAKKHGLEASAMSKTGFFDGRLIEFEKDLTAAKQLFGNIKNIPNKDKSKLFNALHNALNQG